MTIFEQLREAIAATLKVPTDSVTEVTRDEDLTAWDSLGHINLMMALEQTFDLSLEVEDFEKLRSVPAMIEYLKGQGFE